MASYGYTFQSGDGVTPTRLNDARTVSDIVNADIKSDAAIAFSKLAALNSAQILVGNGSNVPTAVSVTGDVTISNAGVTAIAAGAVVTADVADAAITPAKLSQPYTLATAQASTSGTSIDFTGIPSWAKRITVMFDGVSTNGSSIPIIQLGDSGGIETSGYIAGASDFSSYQSQTSGIPTARSWANTFISSGFVTISLVDAATNTWVASGNLNDAGGSAVFSCGGKKATSATLDRVRITTVNGADTFDAGTVNIAYEG